jgi:hypothetical protein
LKVLKIIGWFALIALVVIQFFPMDYNQSKTVPQADFMLVNKVPTTVEKSMHISCYDCHSNNTEYPWYSQIQPAAWFLEGHIKEGKAELNFNEWEDYSNRRKKSKLRSIIKQIESGEMPMDNYTLFHRDAIFSEKEKEAVLNYMKTLKDDLE